MDILLGKHKMSESFHLSKKSYSTIGCLCTTFLRGTFFRDIVRKTVFGGVSIEFSDFLIFHSKFCFKPLEGFGTAVFRTSFPSFTVFVGTFDFRNCFRLKVVPSKVAINTEEYAFRGESVFLDGV